MESALIKLMRRYPPLKETEQKMLLTIIHCSAGKTTITFHKLLFFKPELIFLKILSNILRLKAKEILMLHYSRFIYGLTAFYAKDAYITREDLFSYGLDGLSKAIDKFDITQDIKLSTYAYRRVKGSIYNGLIEQARTIRLPYHIETPLKKFKQYKKKYPKKTDEIIAKELNISLKTIKNWINVDFTTQLDPNFTASPSTENYLDVIDLQDKLKKNLKCRPQLDRKIIEGIFLEGKTCQELALEYDKEVEEIERMLNYNINLLNTPLFQR